MRRSLAAVATLLMLAGCGPTTVILAGPSASSIAVKTGDLPSGMMKCDLSGDIATLLNALKTKDPAAYTTTKNDWDSAQKNGATGAYVAFYADSKANCANVDTTAGSGIGSATYKLVVNFVIQFKDEASAAKGYTTESIFGFSTATLKGAGTAAVEGTKTGLTANSIVVSISIATQAFYIAVWQNKAFMVILAVINIDTATSQKVALAVNGRIH
jgi:hypothetical protein